MRRSERRRRRKAHRAYEADRARLRQGIPRCVLVEMRKAGEFTLDGPDENGRGTPRLIETFVVWNRWQRIEKACVERGWSRAQAILWFKHECKPRLLKHLPLTKENVQLIFDEDYHRSQAAYRCLANH